jgi:Raf kinase inhibitor-like YbhB/YbcL family protein
LNPALSPYPSARAYDQQAMVTFWRWLQWAARVAAATVLLAGCGFLDSGTTVQPRQMTLTSSAFSQLMLPQAYTCHAPKPTTPPLSWSGAPATTKGYAVVVDDSSAPITPYIYWIVFHILPSTSDIQEGQLPTDARQAMNSAGTAGYDPPCPQGQPHKYRITVYALNQLIDLPDGTSLLSAWTAIAAAANGYTARVEVTGNP